MNILIGVHHFPPQYKGGAELRAFRTAAALQARGHTVQVVCVEQATPNQPYHLAWEDDLYEGIHVRRLTLSVPEAPARLGWMYQNPAVGAHLRSWLADLRPDIFHLISGYLLTGSALRAAHELGIPTVVTLTDFWFLCPRIQLLRSDGSLSALPIRAADCARCLGEEQRRFRLAGRWLPPLMARYWQAQSAAIRAVEERLAFLRQTLNQTDAIISPSQFLRGVFVESGVEAERIIFSRQGRDFPGLSPALLDKTPHGPLRLGYLGQIADIKGVHTLFEAARLIPGVPLSITAHGDPAPFPQYAARLGQLAANDARLRLAGAYRAEQLSQVLRELDVIVVPSLWYENSPNVILEAFAHRTPVITANLGGMAELVEHNHSGLLFAPGNAADLARQIRRLVDEPGLLETLRQGIPPVKSTAEEMDELNAIYQRVAALRQNQHTDY